ADAAAAAAPAGKPDAPAAKPPTTTAATAPASAAPVASSAQAATVRGDYHAEVVVIGSGPGGYTAAFRAADLGKKVVLIERFDTLGGVCLNVGWIPSKALLHTAKVVEEAHEMASQGVSFGAPNIDNKKLVAWKNTVV